MRRHICVQSFININWLQYGELNMENPLVANLVASSGASSKFRSANANKIDVTKRTQAECVCVCLYVFQ